MPHQKLNNLGQTLTRNPDLTPVSKPGFLVFLMGPYQWKAVSGAANPTDWDDTSGTYGHDEAVQLLLNLRDSLREQRGLNAFIATDVGIDLNAMDAATQSIEFTKRSNATVFVAPEVGNNLGVGVELGSILEHFYDPNARNPLHSPYYDRIALFRDSGVTSAMVTNGILGTNPRYRLTHHDVWDSVEELDRYTRNFCAHIQNAERDGALPPL